jgi:biopolymer transport protein ExbD
MKLRRTFYFSPALFGFIPLLNVLFLVLVFWITGSKFILQPGVQVTLPATSFALGPQRNAEIVTVTSSPNAAIYYKEKEVTELELAAQFARNKSPDRTVIIKGDDLAPSGKIHRIMDSAQRHGFLVIWAGDYRQP